MKNCPECLKDLNSVKDYPYVYIKDVKRIKIPNVKFPMQFRKTLSPEHAPTELKRALEKSIQEYYDSHFQNKGFWKRLFRRPPREEPSSGKWPTSGEWPSAKVKIGDYIFYAGFSVGFADMPFSPRWAGYSLTNLTEIDGRNYILAAIDPFITKLEHSKGKSLPNDEVFNAFHEHKIPNFPRYKVQYKKSLTHYKCETDNELSRKASELHYKMIFDNGRINNSVHHSDAVNMLARPELAQVPEGFTKTVIGVYQDVGRDYFIEEDKPKPPLAPFVELILKGQLVSDLK